MTTESAQRVSISGLQLLLRSPRGHALANIFRTFGQWLGSPFSHVHWVACALALGSSNPIFTLHSLHDAGYEAWQAVTRVHAGRLEAQGEPHLAAAHLLAVDDPHAAVAVYRSAAVTTMSTLNPHPGQSFRLMDDWVG